MIEIPVWFLVTLSVAAAPVACLLLAMVIVGIYSLFDVLVCALRTRRDGV